MDKLHVRSLTVSEQGIIWEMLMHAAHESSPEAVQQLPELARYAQGWGQVGDCGYGAWLGEKSVGAAWVRCFPKGDRGYGFVSEEIPELAIAVVPTYRGQGIGTQLLQMLLKQVNQSHSGMSLSVRSGNPAIALYTRLGFQPVAHTEVVNRTGGTSFTMVHHFNEG